MSATVTNLRDSFNLAYRAIHQPMPDIDAYIDRAEYEATPATYDVSLDNVDLPEDVALRMLEAKEVHWSHYGWLNACITAIYNLAGDGKYDQAQVYAQWLKAELPEGAEDFPATADLLQYAAGLFPKETFERQNRIVDALKARNFAELKTS